jgi:hypothetical protein
MTVLFDSHSFVKRLTAAGMPEPQAEALAGEHTRWFEDGLATRADLTALAKTSDVIDLAKKIGLKEMELRLGGRIDTVVLRLEAAKSEILKWMFGAIGFQTLVLVGAVLALARALH